MIDPATSFSRPLTFIMPRNAPIFADISFVLFLPCPKRAGVHIKNARVWQPLSRRGQQKFPSTQFPYRQKLKNTLLASMELFPKTVCLKQRWGHICRHLLLILKSSVHWLISPSFCLSLFPSSNVVAFSSNVTTSVTPDPHRSGIEIQLERAYDLKKKKKSVGGLIYWLLEAQESAFSVRLGRGQGLK